jgi:hypothetical protein
VISDLTDNFVAGELLQTMTMSLQCREEDSLVLLDTFGALQLVGYRNEEEGLKSVYTDVTIQYSVTNVGTRNLLITSAVKTTAMTGTLPLFFTTEGILAAPGDTEIMLEILTVNLAGIGDGPGLEFSVEVKGEDSVAGDECEDSDSFTIKIIEA